MPRGIERINPRKRQPNPHIVFIKPLEGPDKAIAQDFLERVAAIVNPIMKDSGLTVMSLEEFPPNMEFWGRNFNAGECIQLVLKHPRTHMWLSFEQVQYTMIHELAHIKQMNHSRAFWSVRNKFATHLHSLHLKQYTGEGFWSAGRALSSSQPFLHNRPLAENELPESLCGGTFRSPKKRPNAAGGAGGKRKITYAERQQRRKERKFGKGEGMKLGGDVEERVKLETTGSGSGSGKGRGRAGGEAGSATINPPQTLIKPPKIASSKRSRELRAAAALKRFETNVKSEEDEAPKKEEESDDDGSTGSEWDDEIDAEDEKLAVDVGGGKRLVPVSVKEEDESDLDERRNEWAELRGCATVGGAGGGVVIPPDERGGDASEKAANDQSGNSAQDGGKGKGKAPSPVSGSSGAGRRDGNVSEGGAGGGGAGAGAGAGRRGLDAFLNLGTTSKVEQDPPKKNSISRTAGNGDPQRQPQQQQQIRDNSACEPTAIISIDSSDDETPRNKSNNERTIPTHSLEKSTSNPSTSMPAAQGNFLCTACSTQNASGAITCHICSNVLAPAAHPGSWKCTSGGEYWNSSDCGRCGGCGEVRGR
ncbi:WLM domain-containing protein [Peziza echinospora]|nr:WLM domain-containing protein [Peziza echinospora]